MSQIATVEAIPVRLPRGGSPPAADRLPDSPFYRTPHRGLIYAPHSDRVYVKITTDDGHVGWGEGGVMGAAVTAEIVRTFLAPQLVGQDPLRVEFLWCQMRRAMWDRGSMGGFLSEAMAGVDLALWDLKGRILQQPVCALAGGPFVDRVRAYQSGVPGASPAERAAHAKEFVARGVNAIKLHLTGGAADTIASVAAVRDAVGPDVALMVDVHNMYDVADAIRVGRELERLDVYFFEAPTDPENLAGLTEIARSLQLRIALGEGERSLHEYRDRLVARAVDVLQPDINFVGFTQMRQIALLAQAFHVEMAPHLSGTLGWAVAASLHLMAAIPNGSMLEYRLHTFEQTAGLYKQSLHWADGYLQLPDGPGFGLEPDEAALREYAI
jgi:galactonate dehydratase